MKGCFVLHRRFAFLGHYIAQHLKEQGQIQEACGIVYTRPSLEFIQAQPGETYSNLLLDEEIHAKFKTETLNRDFIAALEKDYGTPFLWQCLTVDRIIFNGQLVREYPHDWPSLSHEDMLRLLQVTAKELTKFLDAEKPDFIFTSAICTVSQFMLYQMAKKRGIKTFIVQMASTRNRYVISETYDSFTGVDALFNGDRSVLKNSPHWKEAEEFLAEFRAKPLPYYDKSTPSAQPVGRTKQFRFLNPKYGIDTLRVLFGNLREHLKRNNQDDYSYITPWAYFSDACKRKLRNLVGQDDLYDECTPDTEDFAFFPLHLEPEIALLLQAPTQTDQINLIRNIARSLPVNFKLYVKDHPEMAQYRTREYYMSLKRNPNVKLINPKVSSFVITPHAKLITTITGSVGWEALMLQKPVISFGHVFYNTLPATTYCNNLEELPFVVKDRLERDRHSEEDLVAYIAAIFMDSAQLNLHYLWMDEPSFEKKREGVRPLADALARRIAEIQVP